MTAYRKFILEAKAPAKFVPNTQKIANHRKALKNLQIKSQAVAKSLNEISSSKTMPPKLKTARIQQEKALQNYLRASIMYKQAEIKQLSSPE